MLVKDRYTILVVDDSPEDLATYQRYLHRDRHNSYNIQTAHYAAEGLQFCQTHWPDFIVLDFRLPDLNGLQFIDALEAQANGQSLPAILVLTGQGNEEIAVALMKKGVQDYLIKNKLTELGLQSTVKQILDRVQLQRSLEIQQQWQQVLAEIALRTRRSLNLADILHTAVAEVKQFLHCDRVLVCQFATDRTGTVIAEAVAPALQSMLGRQIVDTCEATDLQLYQQGRQQVINDIYQAQLSTADLRLLAEFQVQAVLVVPILLTPDNAEDCPRLWGLLIAHQCHSSREWTGDSGLFLERLAVQIAIAIQQAELVERLNQELVQRVQTERELGCRTQEQERLIEALAKTTALLKQRNQDLDAFVSIASHDLRAPLRAIRNLATWLSEDLANVLDLSAQKQFSLLTSRVRQMETLLNDLLQYARLGRIEDGVTSVCVADLIAEIVQGLDLPPEFIIEVAPDLPTLVTNRTALSQVFSNLIGNAVKHHTRQDGRVKIAVTRQAKCYQFEVADDGPGIAIEHHQTIFKIFRTLSNVIDTENTGIGLAIVKKIIELQGGTITLKSEIDRGTTFRFTWPLTSDKLTDSALTSPSPLTSNELY